MGNRPLSDWGVGGDDATCGQMATITGFSTPVLSHNGLVVRHHSANTICVDDSVGGPTTDKGVPADCGAVSADGRVPDDGEGAAPADAVAGSGEIGAAAPTLPPLELGAGTVAAAGNAGVSVAARVGTLARGTAEAGT